MYGEHKFLKIFSLVAFATFAAVSCWSTTESLFLTLEHAEIPKWIFWVAVIGLFVLTSICSKLVVDSFNQNLYIEHRKVKFWIGLLGVMVLWGAFSMPTNAHTFFYKQMAKNTAVRELKYLDGELQKLSSENNLKMASDSIWHQFEKEVDTHLSQLKEEINNPQRLGFGPVAESELAKIESMFKIKVGTIQRRGTRNSTQKERNEVCKYYDGAVMDLLKNAENEHNASLENAKENLHNVTKNVTNLRRDITTVLDELNDDQYEKEEVLKNARKLTNKSYAEIIAVIDQLGGNYAYDEEIYRSDRLVKVTKVWGDYFSGRFRHTDYTLWYWILLSIIVDIAAFAFFAIAFKKEDY